MKKIIQRKISSDLTETSGCTKNGAKTRKILKTQLCRAERYDGKKEINNF